MYNKQYQSTKKSMVDIPTHSLYVMHVHIISTIDFLINNWAYLLRLLK